VKESLWAEADDHESSEGASHGQPRQARSREEKAKESATQTSQQAIETGGSRETGGATGATTGTRKPMRGQGE